MRYDDFTIVGIKRKASNFNPAFCEKIIKKGKRIKKLTKALILCARLCLIGAGAKEAYINGSTVSGAIDAQ